MEQLRSFLTGTNIKVVARCLCAVIIVIALGASGWAQSGRQHQRAVLPDSPPPQKSSQSAPTPAPTPQFSLLVTRYTPGASYVSEVVMDRLKKSPALAVVDGRDMKRKEAMNRARDEKKSYVVWLELNQDAFHTTRPEVHYEVYEPGTGKIMTYGDIFLRPVGKVIPGRGIGAGGNVPPPCYTIYPGFDYSLFQASIDVGDRILQAFKLPLPPVCP